MPSDTFSAEPNQPSADSPTRCGLGPRLAWLRSGLSVGLAGGILATLIESVLLRRDDLGSTTPGLWADLFSYFLVTHSVLGVVLCTTACAVNAVLGRWLKRWATWFHPGGIALAAWLVAEGFLVIWLIQVLGGAVLPDGVRGAALFLGIWFGVLLPFALLFSLIRRTIVGRGVAAICRPIAWLAFVMLAASVFVQWRGRSEIRSPTGFWPMNRIESSAPAPSSPPNIVLIVFDALRADRLGCYGYRRPTSPHIDAIAADALVFDKVISPGAWTVPSHASIFTGLYPSQHGACFGFDRLWLDDRFVTLAEALRDRGYQTMALANNPIVSPVTNLAQGFERFAIPRDLGYSSRMIMTPFFIRFLGRFEFLAPILGRWFIEDAGGHATTELAARWLKSRDRSRPFFLFVNYMETHDPYQPRIAYRREFVRPNDLPRSFWSGFNDDSLTWQYALAGNPIYSKDDIAILSGLYDARVREADDHLADLMRLLAAEADLDQTILILTSDHGEGLGEHGLLGHQFSVFNTIAHVPLIVRWPKALRPGRVSRLVQTLDIFPTVLSWAGAECSQSGKLMAQHLGLAIEPATRPAERQAHIEYLGWAASSLDMVARLNPGFDPSPWQARLHAVFDDRWKLIVRFRRSGKDLELFDLLKDAGEQRNLAEDAPLARDQLMQHFMSWRSSFRPFDPNEFASPRDRRVEDEQHRRLRDLGYVQ